MALELQTMVLTSGLYKVEDTDVDGTSVDSVLTAATTIYMVKVDNTLNSAASYFKMYNNAAPTVGTTAPDVIIPVPAYKTATLVVPEGMAFATDLSYACVTTAGTAGTTDPTNAVKLEMVIA